MGEVGPLRFALEIGDPSGGWADVTFVAGEQRVSIRCSHAADSLGALPRGLARVIALGGKVEIDFTDEQHGLLVAAAQRDAQVSLAIKRYYSDGVSAWRSEARRQRVRLRWMGPCVDVARVVSRAYDDLIARVGADGYAAGWGHAPASDALEALRVVGG